jgi:spore germination protein
MPRKGPWLRAAALVAALATAGTGCGPVRLMPGGGTGGGGGGLRVLAFYDPRAERPTGTVQSLLVANRQAISDLSPLWYEVRRDGSLRDLSAGHLKAWAERERIPLMPLVANEGGNDAFLRDPAARARAVDALVAALRSQGYDGLNIDFEELHRADRGPLVAFLRTLYGRVQAMGKRLTVDVVPAGSRRAASAGAYDYPALARYSTDVVLMTYDAHDETSSPGPVAPLAWVRRRVAVALAAGIPRGRLLLGIADYGYDWSGGHGTEIGLRQVDGLLTRFGITPQRTRDGEPHFAYRQGGVTHTVWYEDGVAVVPKVRLARQMGLAGLALWMVGFETPAYWQALRSAAGPVSRSPGSQAASGAPTPTGKASASQGPTAGSAA